MPPKEKKVKAPGKLAHGSVSDQANLIALGWEKVIKARLLGVHHFKITEFEAIMKPAPAPGTLAKALCGLPTDVVLSQLSSEAWPTIKRSTLEPPSTLVWQWRERLCHLAVEHHLP